MSIHQLKDGRWIVKYPDPKKPSGSRREYFGRGAAAEINARSRDRELDLKRTKPRVGDDFGPTFYDLSVEYLQDKGFPMASYAVVISSLGSAINPAIGNVPAMRLTHNDLTKYVRSRRKTVKDNTIRREVGIIQAVMNWAARRRPPLIPSNPIRGFVRPAAADAIISPPTSAEVYAILRHSNERLRRFITVVWYTGLRPGTVETLSLQWSAVSWETGTIRILSANKGGVRLRDVPIHPAFAIELKRWHKEDIKNGHEGYIIHRGKTGGGRIDFSWREAKRKAGITRRLRLYDFRHWYVTTAIEAGADYKTLSEVVGSSPETLRRHYQHVSTAARVSMVERMPVLATRDGNHR